MATDQVSILNNRVVVWQRTGTLILELEVIGTHFPANGAPSDGSSAFFALENISGTDGTVRIDYADGTGWHDYPFFANGSTRRLQIQRKSNNVIGVPATPENISHQGVYNYPVYFFQDLDLPTGAVDDLYPVSRKIKIDFPKFADLKTFFMNEVALHGTLPAALGRFRNLDEITINYAYHLDGISSSFSKIFSKIFSLRVLGFVLGTKIPNFILSSPLLEAVRLEALIDLSGGAVTSRLTGFFSNKLPLLNDFNLGATNIDYQLPNLHRTMTGACVLQDNSSTNFRLSPDLTNWHFIRVYLNGMRMPFTEYQRLMESSEITELVMRHNNINTDFDIAVSNNYISRMEFKDNYAGFFPTFLSKLNALKTIVISAAENLSSWGTAGLSSTLTHFEIETLPLLTPTMPSWFANLISLTSFNSWTWQTQTRIDGHIGSFYAQVEANAPISGSGMFRGLNYSLVAAALKTNENPRPTGTYQAPTGYVQGSANGTPASQMEMIYVLVHQYEMIVSVLNEAGNGIDIYTI